MTQPDIIFIVLDTQRADRLSCYNSELNHPLTPNIDAFADQGVIFDRGISAAQWTIPSHASMFTGLFPTAHQLVQSNLTLGPDTNHLAEIMGAAGYETVGFCNNPLVGVLENGLKRGFQHFYNYAGTFPNLPVRPSRSILDKIKHAVNGFIRRNIALPIQNHFGKSESAFSISLSSFFTPLWSRWGNFKGQNERSVNDVAQFLQERESSDSDKPLFLFLNLMETHLPFFPPKKFVSQVAPEVANDKQSTQRMAAWNREAYRWSLPLPHGIENHDWEVLNAYYDAEVRYQDDYLQRIFDVLKQRANQANTLTIIVGDHGDSLGEHNYFGHAFVAYQELLHVPLILHWPEKIQAGQRVKEPVSTRRVFHTVLNAAGKLPEWPNVNPGEIHGLALTEVLKGNDVENGTVFSEVYPPLNFVKAVDDRQPELIDQFKLRSLRRSIVQSNHKLIQLDDRPDELFDLTADKDELNSLLPQKPPQAVKLGAELERIIGVVELQKETLLAGEAFDLEADEQLLEQLRNLGYVD